MVEENANFVENHVEEEGMGKVDRVEAVTHRFLMTRMEAIITNG